MLSGGEALEEYALRRSSRELIKLLSLAPTIGHIKQKGRLVDIPAEEIKIGDVCVVKPGETFPVDGVVVSGISETDESSITGESRLMEKRIGSLIFSGSVNKDSALEVRAEREASQSQYQRIVKLVKEAQNSKAPVMRLADRYSVWFTGVALLLAGVAWFFSGESVRFLAVLVVATPCPLILATPIAVISGISKSASRGIIVKNGGALEKLGEAEAIIFDKTGTLTLGEPKFSEAISFDATFSIEKIVRLAASIDQMSVHALARALVKYAQKNSLELEIPTNSKEILGSGVEGKLGGREYFFGRLSFIQNLGVNVPKEEEIRHKQFQEQGKIVVYFSNKDTLLGSIVFTDIVRPEMEHVFDEIQKHKIKRVFMLTGDKKTVARKISEQLHIKHFKAELLPEDKVKEVKLIKEQFSPVAMVGDGVNDAPALVEADVGIALAAHGSSASSESADIVIMQNDLMRVHDAVHIAQNVMRIAKQSIFIGLGISILLMVIASLGYIQPVYGALLQEVLDVAVILNALRVNFQKLG